MRAAIAWRLRQLNQEFYTRFGASFAQSRRQPQPGFARLVPYLPSPFSSLLDVGCGHGRFAQAMRAARPFPRYVGVDFSPNLLERARAEWPADQFLRRDVAAAGNLAGVGTFDVVACLAVLQHVPGRENRLALVREMAGHLRAGGRLFLSTWQFLDSQRQRRKILPWRTVGLPEAAVEPGDFLLTWQRDGHGRRYVCLIDAAETAWLAEAAGLQVAHQFRSDGREGDLSLYSVLVRA